MGAEEDENESTFPILSPLNNRLCKVPEVISTFSKPCSIEYDDFGVFKSLLLQRVIDNPSLLVWHTPQNHYPESIKGTQDICEDFGVNALLSRGLDRKGDVSQMMQLVKTYVKAAPCNPTVNQVKVLDAMQNGKFWEGNHWTIEG